VKIPSVSHTADTPFYMLYGDAAIGAAQNIGSYAPANVWSENFRMVLHLNGSSPSVIDSTGSTSPLNTGITATTGQVDGAGYSSGSTNKITVATNLYTLIGGSTTNTVSFWANPTTFANAPVALTWGDGFIEFAPGNGAYWVSGGLRVYSSVASLGSWQYISLVKSGSGDSGTLYRNASPLTVDSGALAGDPTNAGSTILFNFSDTTYAYSGALDEVRVASTSRTADWILTEYNNQNAPGNVGADNFLHFSAEGTTPPPPASGVRHNVLGGE
jgi:hypothetical protein